MDRPDSRHDRRTLSPLDTMRASLKDLDAGQWNDLGGFLDRINQEIEAVEKTKKERTAGP
jgi:hypothetical protein